MKTALTEGFEHNKLKTMKEEIPLMGDNKSFDCADSSSDTKKSKNT